MTAEVPAFERFEAFDLTCGGAYDWLFDCVFL